ncbi:hypothetical protein [Candidatus Finniella inopinata]|uniref:Uncharacterized protein n=1 Tax=Candidatus Finniella inopinata TaxID=1696036 RepID=A0A4Q7DHZ4_9PROT|nr:hypothetical protein [Candidatus Finniella inopinata]RZI45685.1 hypothetical protein EQU50_06175 [Candidatus Finniella inopinata]
MFNVLSSVSQLFFLTLLSFFVLFTIRSLFVRGKIFVCCYHVILFLVLFVASVGGGGVQNAGYHRLEQFILLEKNHQLELAKKNPENYDSMLQIDLQQFKDSNEFKDYLKGYDASVDKAEAVTIGWLFVFLAEISMLCAQLMSRAYSVMRRNISSLPLWFPTNIM